MTLYVVELYVPANTPENNPVEETIEVSEDVIVHVECRFYPGPSGMVKTAAYIGEMQIFPRPAGKYLAGDDETIRWSEFFKLPGGRTEISFRAWSPGTYYDHVITWRIVALPKSVALWWSIMEKFINIMAKLFRVRLE